MPFLRLFCLAFALLLGISAGPGKSLSAQELPDRTYLIPNTHGTIGGWQVSFVEERNIMLNNYLDHLSRTETDPHYRFVFSEVPTLIAMRNLEPKRFEDFQKSLEERRAELVNGFFLEPTVNLSGGEALVKMGVEGLRWQEEVMGVRPRFCWMIDVVGSHRQMPQIVDGLGLEAYIYSRNNPTPENLHWWESPDGTKTLALCAKHYAGLSTLFEAESSLTELEMREIAEELRTRRQHTPENLAPFLLVGQADYSTAPRNPSQPSEFLAKWMEAHPLKRLVFTLAGEYLDYALDRLRGGLATLQNYRGDSAYSYSAFWSDAPRIKQWYRRAEHGLQAAESLATLAHHEKEFEYPSQPFYHAWLQMLLNMDRNTLWASAAGMVFEDPDSWDATDRFESVERTSRDVTAEALTALLGEGDSVGFFNPLNWERSDPISLADSGGRGLQGVQCEQTLTGTILCTPRLPSFGVAAWELTDKATVEAEEVPPASLLENEYYELEIDLKTGDLIRLRLKSTGEEILVGPSNVVRYERPVMEHSPADYMVPRDQRRTLATSREYEAKIRMSRGPVTTTVQISSEFLQGSQLERIVRLYHDSPRIDFITRTRRLPNGGLVSVDFTTPSPIRNALRGIPAGFSLWKPGSEPPSPLPNFLNRDHEIYGFFNTMMPAVRWTSYETRDASGFALLDRGLTGREISGSTASLQLINAWSNYRGLANPWLSGEGELEFEYALVGFEDWQEAQIPRRAWEFNSPPLIQHGLDPAPPRSYLETSDNLILQVVRREEEEIEMRLTEWSGRRAEGRILPSWKSGPAFQTNLMGEARRLLRIDEGGYSLSLRPQQIVTLRFGSKESVSPIEPLLSWVDLVPSSKRESLDLRIHRKGHPRPAGHDPTTGTPEADNPGTTRN